MNMGASFNRTSWYLKGEVLGRELRALNNLGWGFAGGNVQDRVGISGYGPNINIARDPRFGRNSELPGKETTATFLWKTSFAKTGSGQT
jgi:beta-glucosidase-like glycosyl hydrolase